MVGRRPIPTAVKRLRGNPGKRPLPKDEPQAKLGEPKVPPHLSVVARACWNDTCEQMREVGTLTTDVGYLIALKSDAWADYLFHRATVEREGWTITATIGKGIEMEKPHPAVALMAASWAQVLKADIELGLTPAARTRVKVSPPKERDELEELMERGPRRL